MSRIAPNLCEMIGSNIAAQLVGLAGGLIALSKIPACNIQVVGQEKKNLAGLSNNSIVPHTGILFYCDIVQACPPYLRRKALKIVAGEVSLATRIDCSQTTFDGAEGYKLRRAIEEKLEKFQEPEQDQADTEEEEELVEKPKAVDIKVRNVDGFVEIYKATGNLSIGTVLATIRDIFCVRSGAIQDDYGPCVEDTLIQNTTGVLSFIGGYRVDNTAGAAATCQKLNDSKVSTDSSTDSLPTSGSGTVVVTTSHSLCNGTLVLENGLFYVCCTAHSLVGYNPADDRVTLEENIVLTLYAQTTTPIKLKWIECSHTVRAHRTSTDPDSRKWDMCVFLIEPDADTVPILQASHLALHRLEVNTANRRLFGAGLLPDEFDRCSYATYFLEDRITLVNNSSGLAMLTQSDPPAGLCGLGLTDRKQRLIAFVASSAIVHNITTTRLILASRFITLINQGFDCVSVQHPEESLSDSTGNSLPSSSISSSSSGLHTIHNDSAASESHSISIIHEDLYLLSEDKAQQDHFNNAVTSSTLTSDSAALNGSSASSGQFAQEVVRDSVDDEFGNNVAGDINQVCRIEQLHEQQELIDSGGSSSSPDGCDHSDHEEWRRQYEAVVDRYYERQKRRWSGSINNKDQWARMTRRKWN